MSIAPPGAISQLCLLLHWVSTSDADDGLADVVSPQQPHEGRWHLLEAFCNVLAILQFSLQKQNKAAC